MKQQLKFRADNLIIIIYNNNIIIIIIIYIYIYKFLRNFELVI